MNKRLLISVLNYKNFQQTISCVDQLLTFSTVKSPNVDVIIVDNHSENNSFKILSKYYKSTKVKVLETKENNGYSFGNNFSIKYQEKREIYYNYFAVINPDVRVEKDIFSPLLEDLDNHNKIAIISTLIHSNGKVSVKNQSWRIPNERDIWLDSLLINNRNTYCSEYLVINKNLLQTEVIPGSFFIVRASVFKRIGYFDENMFMYNEEIVLAIKIKRIGKIAVIDPRYSYDHSHPIYTKHEIYKHYRNNFNNIKKMYKIGARSRQYVCEKYYSSKGVLMLKATNMVNYFFLYLKYMLAHFYN